MLMTRTRPPPQPHCWPRAQGGRSLLSLVGVIADSDDQQISGAPEFAIALRTQLLVSGGLGMHRGRLPACPPACLPACPPACPPARLPASKNCCPPPPPKTVQTRRWGATRTPSRPSRSTRRRLDGPTQRATALQRCVRRALLGVSGAPHAAPHHASHTKPCRATPRAPSTGQTTIANS